MASGTGLSMNWIEIKFLQGLMPVPNKSLTTLPNHSTLSFDRAQGHNSFCLRCLFFSEYNLGNVCRITK